MLRASMRCTAILVIVVVSSVLPGPVPREGGSAGPSGLPAAPLGWMDRARAAAARAEYDFGASRDGVVAAPNRAQGLRLSVRDEGVRVTPRRPGAASWALDLRLHRFGRDGALAGVGPGVVRAEGERVALARPELGVTEWYVNAPGGIEQGFTIAAPPAGPGASPVVLEIAYEGGLGARPGAAGKDLAFADAGGEARLLYGGLVVLDASGAEVDSALALVPGAVRIAVNDAGRPYPLIVDPTLITPSWAVVADQPDARFGAAVAGVGDVDGDGYGDVLVGAYQFDDGLFDQGRVFMFRGSPDGPSPFPDWTASGEQLGEWFGYSVAPAGDLNHDGYADVIIGAPQYDNLLNFDGGRAFVYLGSSGGLGTEPAWSAGLGQNSAHLGASVAAAGDVNGDGRGDLVVGAPDYDNGQTTDEGRAFLYFGSEGGPSVEPGWSAGSGLFSSACGAAVAGAGDVDGDGFDDILVGAPLFDNAGFFDEGRVFLHYGSPAGPAPDRLWTFDSNKMFARLGQSVAGAGDVNADGLADVIVGAPGYDGGRAFVFHGSAAGLGAAPDWDARMNRGTSQFGAAVAGVGDVTGDGFADVAVGAPRFGDRWVAATGMFQVYFGGAGRLRNTATWSAQGTQVNELLGGALAGAGDVNGDGLSDIIAGAVGTDNVDLQAPNAGGATVYLGLRTRQTLTTFITHGVRPGD